MDLKDGLVFSYIFKDGKGQHLDFKQVKEWNPAKGILWIHLDYKSEGVRKWLIEKSGIDPISCEALLAEDTRPRAVSSSNALLLILRGVNCNPGADPEDMISIRMWFEENRIITMRHRKVMAIEDIDNSLKAGKGPDSANEFLVTIANKLVDRMGDVISEVDDSVDELEELVLTAQSYELRPKLANIRRQTISLRRYISPQRDVLARLQNEKISWLSDMDKVRIREISERTSRFVDDLDSARDRAAITQEELNSRLSEQMNKTMYILSIITAIFLPLGLITGLLGINVGGLPGVENKFAFMVVCISLVLFACIQFLLFRKNKWI